MLRTRLLPLSRSENLREPSQECKGTQKRYYTACTANNPNVVWFIECEECIPEFQLETLARIRYSEVVTIETRLGKYNMADAHRRYVC